MLTKSFSQLWLSGWGTVWWCNLRKCLMTAATQSEGISGWWLKFGPLWSVMSREGARTHHPLLWEHTCKPPLYASQVALGLMVLSSSGPPLFWPWHFSRPWTLRAKCNAGVEAFYGPEWQNDIRHKGQWHKRWRMTNQMTENGCNIHF